MRFINIILLVLFLVNCSDKNLSFSGKRINNIPLNDLSILIPNRFKERITRWYKDRSPAVIRTYDIMNNELIKELRYYNSGVLKHEAIYSNGALDPFSSVIWWHPEGERLSQLIINDSLKMINGNIWRENGELRFHFENNNYYWWDKNGSLEFKGSLNDTSFILPIWSNNGRFIGTRKLISKSIPLLIEEWTLFDKNYNPLIKGNVLCMIRDNKTLDRVINEEWTLMDSTRDLELLQLSAQTLLNTIVGNNNFISGIDWSPDNAEYVTSLLDSSNSNINNSDKRYFKSRQFNQNYILELHSDGKFQYTCQDKYTDSGHYWYNKSGEKLFIHYESGIFSGESHMIKIINHRKIFYQFRNSYYFLTSANNQIKSSI